MTTATATSSVTLPRAVRRQLAAIRDSEGSAPVDGENQADASDGAAASADAAQSDTNPRRDDAPAPSPAVQDPRENDPAYWRQRFNVTQGMLRRLQETSTQAIGERDRQLDELRGRIRALEDAGSSRPSSARPDLTAFFTPEQIDQFGEDQCAAMAAAASKAAREQAQALIDSEVAPMRMRAKEEEQRAQASREQQFWIDLGEAVPGYQAINADPAWLDWLAEEDDLTGQVRQDILDRHRAGFNAAGVAKLFRAFESATAAPARKSPPVQPASRTASGGASGAQATLRGYPSREEIREFYKRAATGKVSDKERTEFEARLKAS